MAIKFYINNIEVKVQNNATLLSTQDDSLDTATMDLELSQIKNSILPQSKLKVEDTDNNEVWNFVIVRDNVTIVKKSSPMLYKHSLVLTQNIHELTTHIVRNTVFAASSKANSIEYRALGYCQILGTANQSFGVITSYTNVSAFKFGQTITKTMADAFGGAYKNNEVQNNLTYRGKVHNAYINITTYLKTYAKSDGGSTETDEAGHTFNNAYDWDINKHTSIHFAIKKNGTEILGSDISVSSGQTKVFLTDTEINTINNSCSKGDVLTLTISSANFDLSTHTIDMSTFLVGPSLSRYFNNHIVIVDAKLVLNTSRYTLYDVLDILRKQCKKDYNGSNNTSLYTMPSVNSVQGKILSKITAPDFGFQSQNLFACVCEVMQVIDAIPTLDENGVLGFEYLNDIGKTPTSLSIVDNIKNIDEQNFTNKLIANYQNARQTYPVVHPSVNGYSRMGSSAYGIPTVQDYSFFTPSAIDELVSVKLKYSGSFGLEIHTNFVWYGEQLQSWTTNTYNDVTLPNPYVELKDVIFSAEEYALFYFYTDEDTFPSKNNTLYYNQGGKSINFGAITDTDGSGTKQNIYRLAVRRAIALNIGYDDIYLYRPYLTSVNKIDQLFNVTVPQVVQNLKLQVSYFSKHDGRASIESVESKHEGESFVAQSNANVQLNRLGTNMQGLIARLGTEKKSLTLDMTSYGSRIRKGTLWVDDDGNKYIANKVKTTFSTSSNKCIIEVEMSKNFNAISSFTKLDQEKRFYEISERLTSKGYENITEFVYLSKTDKRNLAEQTAISRNALYSMFKGTLVGDENTWKVDMATIKPYENETDVNAIDLKKYNRVSSGTYPEIVCPIHSYGLGNMICLEMGYESPLNAGNRLVGVGSPNDPYINKTTLYTENYGYADKLDVAIYQDSTTEHEFDENYPLINPTGTKLIDIAQFYYYKKSNEIFHLNYEIAFMPSATYTTDGYGCKRYQYEEIFVGSRFIDNNSLISTNESRGAKTLYLYVGTTDEEKYSIIDKKALGTNKGIATITVATSGSTNSGSINVTFSGTIASAKSWALADEKGNLYLSVNQNLTNATELNLYYFTRINRL